jgi:hypothetical protein
MTDPNMLRRSGSRVCPLMADRTEKKGDLEIGYHTNYYNEEYICEPSRCLYCNAILFSEEIEPHFDGQTTYLCKKRSPFKRELIEDILNPKEGEPKYYYKLNF